MFVFPILVNCQLEKVPEALNIVIRSKDAGKTWEDLSSGLPEGWKASYIYADSHEIIVGSYQDLFRKNLRTASTGWDKAFFLQDHLGGVQSGKAGPYVYNFWMGLFQEGLSGSGIWEPRFKSVTNGVIRTVLEVSEEKILIGGDSGIFKSLDGGKSWKHVFDSTMITHIIIKDGILIAGGSSGLLRSSDGGDHWSWAIEGRGPVRKLRIIGDQIAVITNGVGPWEEVVKSTDGIANSLLFSVDGGVSWNAMEGGLIADRLIYDPEKDIKAKFIHDIIQVEQYLLCSHDTGISRSLDGGKTWELILPIEYGQLYGFAVSNNIIYVTMVGTLGGC